MERERERERETDRQTHTHTQTDTQTDRDAKMHACILRYMDTHTYPLVEETGTGSRTLTPQLYTVLVLG